MATSFPASLDSFSNPAGTDDVSTVVKHSTHHANHNDAIEALEAKVGINSSAVPTSLDYRIAQLEAGGGSYTDEQAQDAIGAMINASLSYVDATPLLGINLGNANVWTVDQSVPDEVYGPSWNGSMEIPTKNALYDKIETVAGVTVTPYQETPAGTVNGSNAVFTLANTPANAANVIFMFDGVVQRNGVDYTMAGAVATFTVAPETGTEIWAAYNTLTSSASIPYVDVTGTTQQIAVNTKYKANNVALITLTLPTSAALGEQVFVRGYGTGGWKVAQNASQVIHGSSDTTTGTGGSLASQTRYDCVTLECVVANNEWLIINQRGTLTVV